MEEWERFLAQDFFSDNKKMIENAVQTAQRMLAEDLAPFEIDLFMESLLMKPVALLETVSRQRGEDAWSSLLIKAFTLLTDIVEKFPNIEPYYDDIEACCSLLYPAVVRAKALSCLSQLAPRHRPREELVRAQELALAVDDTCKAARVHLLGVLCECHPELFPDVTSLWRTFLNMLDSHIGSAKTSLNVAKEVLGAVLRLFKHFGTDLVVSEVYDFYEKMKVFINAPRCHQVCCSILERYSGLFMERVSADNKLRSYLWKSLSKESRPALIAVYRRCFEHDAHLQVVMKELEHHSYSDRPLTKYTALFALGDEPAAGRAPADVQLLERRLRDRAAHAHVDEISWCIRARVFNSERLLQAAIACCDGLPPAALDDIIVRNALDASGHVRTSAIVYLTSETCAASERPHRERLLSVWRALLAPDVTDDVTAARSKLVLEQYSRHATLLLEAFLDDGPEELPPKLRELLDLTAFVVETHEASAFVVSIGAFVRTTCTYARVYACAASVRLLRAIAARGADVDEVYQGIDISGCDDDELLLQLCLALLDAPAHRQALLAVKVLLSRCGAEPAMLSKAVTTLETLILTRKEELDQELLQEAIYLVARIRELNDGSSKDHRILQRDAVMFLGKFGSNESYNKVQSGNEVSTTGLKELLCLDVPMNGITLKLDLRCVLQRAIFAEDLDSLDALVTVMCTNSAEPSSPPAAAALCRVTAAMAGRSAHAARAAAACGHRAAHQLLAYAVKETCVSGRAALLEAVGGALACGTRQQVAELSEDVVTAAQRLHGTSQTKVDLLSTVFRAMGENNDLSQNFLPRVLVSVLTTHLPSTRRVFSDVSQLLIEKISLFGERELETLVYSVLQTLSGNDFEMNVRSKRVMAEAVTFLKRLYDLKELPDVSVMLERFREPRAGVLYVMSEVQSVFAREELCRELVGRTEWMRQFYDLTAEGAAMFDAVLYFIATFSDVLFEVHYEKTVKKISQIVESITPEQMIYAHKNFSSCMDAVRRCLGHMPRAIPVSVGAWLQAHVPTVTQCVETCGGVAEAMTYVVGVVDVTAAPCDLRPHAKDWLQCIRAIGTDLSNKDDKCLTDLVRVCVAVLPPEDVRDIIWADELDDTLTFCRTYISAFAEFFSKRPCVLLAPAWSELVVLLPDLVQHTVTRRRGHVGDVMELVDELWSSYECRSDFEGKYSLLLELSRHNMGAAGQSPPQWALRMLGAVDTPREDAIRLVALLPAGDEYSSAYASFAGASPARLSELRELSACALRALLDGCARTADRALLALLARLADGDSTKGWWDKAFDDCMKEVASKAQVDLLQHVYELSKGGWTTGACDRLLVPLLRYTAPSVCEEFFSVRLAELFSVLRKSPREGAPAAVRRDCVLDHTRAFAVLAVAFGKVPREHIECSTSVLYGRLTDAGERSFLLPYTVCVCGAQLRQLPDDGLGVVYRLFQCAVYNCMTSALCCRAPNMDTYSAVFDMAVWRRLVDDQLPYYVPITEQWRQPVTRQAVAVDMSGDHPLLTARTSSRSAHFLRTLSEDPLLYDIPEAEDTGVLQEVQLADNHLNRHECAATLTALLCHVAARTPAAGSAPRWLLTLAAALHPAPHPAPCPFPPYTDTNVRCLLAQMVCNCKEELRPHAAALRPALLAFVADAGDNISGLHLNILDTLIHWREEAGAEVDAHHLNAVVRSLAGEARRHHRPAETAGRPDAALLARLDQLAGMYGRWITVARECCLLNDKFFEADNQLGMKIVRIFAKNNVDLSDVAEGMVAELNQDAWAAVGAGGAGRALGVAAGSLTSQRAASLVAGFRQAAASLRRKDRLPHYVSLVYYTQRAWPACCDGDMVRDIADLANKIPGGEKQKCWDIVATYLAHAAPGDHVDAVLDMLDISGLVSEGRALALAERALPLAGERLRRRLSLQLAERPGPELLTALEVALSSSAPDEPQSKRRGAKSPLLSQELRPVLVGAARALPAAALPRAAALLSTDHALRFSESFALAAGRAHRALQLYLYRERGAGDTSPAGNPAPSRSANDSGAVASAGGQASLDNVLSSVLRFAERQPGVAGELCVQLAPRAAGPALAPLLLEQLRLQPAPLLLRLARRYVDSCCELPGFPEAVDELVRSAAGREHRALLAALQQELRLWRAGPDYFVLGSHVADEDVEMTELRTEFCINALADYFGKLAHWDELADQRRAALAAALPALWADEDTFENGLDRYTDVAGQEWFGAMVGLSRGAGAVPGRGASPRRLLAQVDRWPRCLFDVSAVSEAVEWQQWRDGTSSEMDCRKLTASVEREDCLAKWAARLMIRRQFLKSMEVDSDVQSPEEEGYRGAWRALSRSHQLQWVRRANQMELPAAALAGLEDVDDLYESEMLQWMVQKMIALRTMGLQRNDRDKLQKALDLFETAARFREAAAAEHALAAEHCRLLLLADMDILSPDKISSLCKDLQSPETFAGLVPSEELRATLDSLFTIIMTCLYDHCLGDMSLLKEMSSTLAAYRRLRPGAPAALADMLVQRLGQCHVTELPHDVASAVFQTLSAMRDQLDEFALELIRGSQQLFPDAVRYRQLFAADESLQQARLMLSLVADPGHCLHQYCRRLLHALQTKDAVAWARTFGRMKTKMFENPFAGADYRVLELHRRPLYDMERYDESSMSSRRGVLERLVGELRPPERRTLSLPRLCPALCAPRDTATERALRTLLKWTDDGVLQFEETVHVYTESIRRAARLAVRGAGGAGRARRYVVKSGEELRGDAAALRCHAALAGHSGYWVTPLSEDCGLIEYLEEHDTVRDLIMQSTETDVSALLSSGPSAPPEPVQQRAAALQLYERRCSSIPATLLRSAMERNCSSVDEFLRKKERFTESLSHITVVNWLLGVGDRHLDNVLISRADGALRNIDWGAVGQRGRAELPCARLTRNLLALADPQLLERRLQAVVRDVRARWPTLAAVLHVSFSWMDDFEDMMADTCELMKGAALPHRVTQRALRRAGGTFHQQYIELLDEVFEDVEDKSMYSVEEQVACLLRQCTDPRLLSVTRPGWEPWL